MVAIGGEGGRHAGHGGGNIVAVTPGVTALRVEQRRSPGVAEPAGHRSDLVGGAAGYQRPAREQHAVIVVAAAQPGILRLGAEHPVGRELIVETGLHAAHEAGVAADQAVVTGKGATDMAADIEAGPVIDHGRRGVGRRLGIGPGRHVSGKRRARKSGQGSQAGSADQNLLHR